MFNSRKDKATPFLVVGLGNPGEQYRYTRHNMGFLTADLLADTWRVRMNKHKHKAEYGEATVQGKRIVLVKPQTYMNLSGEAVASLLRWYHVPLSQLIVIYDDIDLPLGRLRVRGNGSAGTHNGMRSVIQHLNSQDFPRIRVGIGKPPEGWDLADFVTSRLTSGEQEIQMPTLKLAAQVADMWVRSGLDAAMRLGNQGGEIRNPPHDAVNLDKDERSRS